MAVKYNEVMEHVQLSAEAKSRILDNVRNAEIAKKEEKKDPKILFSSGFRKWATIAACIAILVVTGFALRFGAPSPSGIVASPSSSTVECASIKELSETVGFTVEDVTLAAADPEQIQYLSFFGKIAQISVQGSGQNFTFRKAEGNDDVSGDYNSYEDEKIVKAEGIDVTLKGEGGEVLLAIWQENGFSYSIAFSPAVKEELAGELIRAIIAQ